MKDPTEFRKRFAAWKNGELPYEAGLPKYADGKGETVTDYPIPFIKDKVVKLTDAGLATGAVFSTNLLDSIADNADRAGLDLLTALGLATKESTLGNPTDDRSMRTLLSALRQKELTNYLLEAYGLSYDLLFGLHINKGDIVRGQELINWYKDKNNIEHKPSPPLSTTHPDRKSVIQKAFEFYKLYPDRYNPGQKNYQRLVDKRGAEVMGSPEVLKWLKERNIKKATGRFNRLNPLLNESKLNPTKYKDGKLPRYKDGDESITVGEYNVYPSAIGASELNVTTPEVVVTGKDKRPLYLRYDAERSVYNSDDVISGFNALTLGGMNNLSPTQWARRFYDAPKLFSGDMSFSDYTNRWLNGNEGIVSANFEKNHPYLSMAINSGADILTGAAANKLLQLNKLSRLQKMYTSVPKTVDKVTGEVMSDLFRKGYNGTVWTSNNPDYGYYLTNGGETFDVFFDPKKLSLLDTPHAPEGTYFVWNRLPFKGKGGKIHVNPKAKVDDTAFMYNTKNDALANTDRFGTLIESNDALHPFMEPRLMNKNTLGLKEGLKTDHVVRYSKMLNRDGAKFHNVYDGGAEDLRGFVYDTPLEEVVLNPGAEYFWTEHNAGRLGLLNQMPYKNLIPYTSTGTLSNLTHTRNEPRNK